MRDQTPMSAKEVRKEILDELLLSLDDGMTIADACIGEMERTKSSEAIVSLIIARQRLAEVYKSLGIEPFKRPPGMEKCRKCMDTGLTAGWVPSYGDPDNHGAAQEAEPCEDCDARQKKKGASHE